MSGCVDVERVKAGSEFRLQRLVDGPVSCEPREPGEGRRPDADGIVRLSARRCASVPMVKVGLVHYIQLCRGKSSSKSGLNSIRAACQFLRH